MDIHPAAVGPTRTDGNFRLPRAMVPLAFTGERMTSSAEGQIEFEHYHRYCLARDLCDGRDVLDVAAGEGYGAALLAGVARSVVGVEIDAESVAHAKANYVFGNLRFLQGDALALPLPDGCVDVVVSFETLEHVADHARFIGEVRRVLRPGGVFVVSTPDRAVYSAPGTEPNPFHVLELTDAEFRTLLHAHFGHVCVLAQRAVLGSMLAGPGQQTWRSYERRGRDFVEATNGLARAQYLVAVASDAPLPPVASSVYLDGRVVHDVVYRAHHYGELEAQAREFAQQRDIARNEARQAAEAVETATARLAASEAATEALLAERRREREAYLQETDRLRGDLREAERGREAARQEAALAHQAQDALRRSTSWMLTAPLRGIAERHPGLISRARGVLHRHPTARREAAWVLRSAWRLVGLRPPLPRPRHDQSASLPAAPPTAATLRSQAAVWFFVGDTLDWLASHGHLTGVGKVTAELFAAAWADGSGMVWYPAVLSEGGGLAAYQPGRALGSTAAARDFQATLDAIPVTDIQPQAGDHVMFTGVIWNPSYVALFARLRAEGIRFSVLVHDLIPIDNADFASPAHVSGFKLWLRAAVVDVETLFVSSRHGRDQLAAWCAAEGLTPRQPIEVICFGNSQRPPAGAALRAEVRQPFVLSVGTIDTRKNQSLLCRTWARLHADLGAARVPQLVLVGRDDLRLASSEPVRSLVRAGAICLLADVSDAELDALYRDSLFTAFASLAEGHGLPVAESLTYGKLPVVSALPQIREYAGDRPWYFDPTDPDDAYRMLRRAIEQPGARLAAERHIALTWRPAGWAVPARAINHVLARTLAAPAPVPLVPRLDLPLARLRHIARRWSETAAPDVSIIIVNWNAAEMTRACVHHIWASTTGVTYEILIADNGSAPGEAVALRDLAPGVRVLPLGVNRYFGEANNIAAEHARGRLLCLLNNDVFVAPGWLEVLCAALRDTPSAGAVGPVFVFPDNSIQEAGGMLNEAGFPERYARGEPIDRIAGLLPRKVDYISAATLLLSRETFMQAGGFDLAYEPAYYEDTDLCFKIAALGQEVWLCPDVIVMHLEGYSTGDAVVPSARKKALGDLNRSKFVSRWGDFLRSRDAADLAATRPNFMPPPPAAAARPVAGVRRRAFVFSPYFLTPGGGERYLLTLAFALTPDHDVTVVTPNPYSRLRLRNLGCEFGIDLTQCATASSAELAGLGHFDVMVAMGNFVIPSIAAQASLNLYHCQFPFDIPAGEVPKGSGLAGYDAIIVNSEYTRQNTMAALTRGGLPALPVQVIYPPVPQLAGGAARKKPIILTVGRFFVGGHVKRHDLLIEAFRTLHRRHGGQIEFHLAGSSMARPEDTDYLDRLHRVASDLPVVFHVNCSATKLKSLYADACVYWHGTGLSANLAQHPEHAEHFGISIVEAMSAQCVAFALNAGGAREIITDGVDGVLYESADDLVVRTLALVAPDQADARLRIGAAAGIRAAAFTQERFVADVRAACRVGAPAG